jgi:hypothetical protein
MQKESGENLATLPVSGVHLQKALDRVISWAEMLF